MQCGKSLRNWKTITLAPLFIVKQSDNFSLLMFSIRSLKWLYLENSMDPKKRTVEMFHSLIDILNREHILYSMGIPGGSVCVPIATIAYGMDIDCKDVKVVIHYGPSYKLETYLQESGKAGWNSTEQCRAFMLYSSLMMKHSSEDIKSYVKDSSRCRRKILLENFDVEDFSLPTYEHFHKCCNICQKECKCQENSCDFVFFNLQSSEVQETEQCFRNVIEKYYFMQGTWLSGQVVPSWGVLVCCFCKRDHPIRLNTVFHLDL